MQTTKKALLGVPDAAAELGVPEELLRRGIEEGSIPGLKVGRLLKLPAWWVKQQIKGPEAAGKAA